MGNNSTETKSSKHDLIEKLCLENEIETMHLRMFLHEKGFVTLTEAEYDELE